MYRGTSGLVATGVEVGVAVGSFGVDVGGIGLDVEVADGASGMDVATGCALHPANMTMSRNTPTM